VRHDARHGVHGLTSPTNQGVPARIPVVEAVVIPHHRSSVGCHRIGNTPRTRPATQEESMGHRPASSTPSSTRRPPHGVRLAGTVLPLSSIRRDRARLTNSVQHGARRGRLRYRLCCPGRDLRLVIRVRDGHHHLAGWPGEGHERGRLRVPQARPDPHRPIHLCRRRHRRAPGLAERPPHPAAGAASDRHRASVSCPGGSSAEARRGVGLVGLTHLMWEIAGLNRSAPTARRTTWSSCHRLISSYLPHITDASSTRRCPWHGASTCRWREAPRRCW
jgi:hypothetical protein